MKLTFLAVLMATQALAGGSESTGGNGDGTVRLPDGSQALADRYLDRDKYVPVTLPGVAAPVAEKLSETLKKIRLLLARYQIQSSGFWDDHVFGKRVQFRMAKELTCQDPIELKDASLKPTLVGLACTSGWETQIKPEVFEKLTPRQQALGLIHERLHAFYGGAADAHYWIAPFITAIEDLLKLQDDQLVGNREFLSGSQMDSIRLLYESAQALGFNVEAPGKKYQIWRRGGGLVRIDKTEVSDDSFIGIGSLVGAGYPAKVQISSSVFLNTLAESGGSISDSVLVTCDLNGVVMSDSTCRNSDIEHATVNEGSVIEGTESHPSSLYGGAVISNSKVIQSSVYGSGGIGINLSSSQRSYFCNGEKCVGDVPVRGSTIVNSKLNSVGLNGSVITNSKLIAGVTWDAKVDQCKMDSFIMDQGSHCVNSSVESIIFSKNSGIQNSKLQRGSGKDGSNFFRFESNTIDAGVVVKGLYANFLNSKTSKVEVLDLSLHFKSESGGVMDFGSMEECHAEVKLGYWERSRAQDWRTIERTIRSPREFINSFCQ